MKLRASWLLLPASISSGACGASRVAPSPAPCVAVPAAADAGGVGDASAGDASASAAVEPPAQPPPPSPPSTFDVAAIDAYLTRLVPSRGFIGLSVAVVMDGKIVLEKGYGQSSLAPDAPVQASTAFLVGSIAKQLVSALVLKLAEEKKLSLEDKVAKYFPDLTRAKDITLYDLMTHVSGYRDSSPLPFLDREESQPAPPDEIILRYARRPLDFEPRTHFSYSNTGYKILGRVIEKVTGKPLGAVVDERIFQPLGMSRSSYMPAEGTAGLATGYTTFALGPPVPAPAAGRGWDFGSSGLYAPAGDLARWDIGLMGGQVLGPESFKRFTTPRRLVDGRSTNYGCGVQATTNRAGEELLQHGGRDPGFVGWNYLVPRTHSAVIVLSNRDDILPWDLVTDIAALINQEHRPPPLQVAGPPADEVARELFAQLQAGHVDRSRLGEELSFFLTDAKIEAASANLRPFGAPTRVVLDGVPQERGGMEESTVQLVFGKAKLQAAMTRTVEGKVEQFTITKP